MREEMDQNRIETKPRQGFGIDFEAKKKEKDLSSSNAVTV